MNTISTGRLLAVAATIAVSAPSVALADDAPHVEPAAPNAEAPEVMYAKKTELSFEGLDVEGELVRPNGAVVQARKRAEFAPMIRLRTDFNEELAESVDEIK